jgi:hypothetical protein
MGEDGRTSPERDSERYGGDSERYAGDSERYGGDSERYPIPRDPPPAPPEIGPEAGLDTGPEPVAEDAPEPAAGGERPRMEPGCDPDPEVYLEPDEAAKLVPSVYPLAHAGKGGFAVERATGRAVYVSGEIQWDVLRDGRRPRSSVPTPRIADGRDRPMPRRPPRHPDVRSEQINIRLNRADREAVRRAARLYGVAPTTLCRILIQRGVTAILDDEAPPEGADGRDWGS